MTKELTTRRFIDVLATIPTEQKIPAINAAKAYNPRWADIPGQDWSVITCLHVLQFGGMATIERIITRVRSAQTAAQFYTPTIQDVRTYSGEGYARQYVTAIVLYWLTKVQINEDEITAEERNVFIIEDLMSNYSDLRFEDISLMFYSGVMGKYGPIYGAIHLHTVCGSEGWAGKYIQEHYREVRRHREQPRVKEVAPELPAVPMPADIRRDFEALEQRLTMQQRQHSKPSAQTRSSLTYQSISHYCQVHQLDTREYITQLRQRFESEYTESTGVKKDTYIAIKSQEWLAALNAGKAEVLHQI